MVQSELSASWLRRQPVGTALIVVGVLMIGVSLAVPGLSLHRSAWSDEQARQYQATSARLHQLSHEFAEAESREAAAAVQGEFDQARTDYGRLRSRLDTARGLSGRVATFLRVAGAVLAAAGAVVVVSGRRP